MRLWNCYLCVLSVELLALLAPSELDKLAQLARDAELRQRMGKASRRRALAEFDVQVMVERYARMFREVAGVRETVL